MARAIPDSVRAAATAARAEIGGACEANRYYDANESHSVDIVRCAGVPEHGYAVQTTVSLHLNPNRLDDDDIRTELVAVAGREIEHMANALSTAAFYVMKNGWLAAPGVVFPGILTGYPLPTSMEHLLWYPPFPWEGLSAVAISDDLTIHWLLGIPIYESERRYLDEHGFFELENLFDEVGLSYFDLGRRPVT
jgi:hypothetical protein